VTKALVTWTRRHAALVLGALAVALYLEHPFTVAFCGAASLLALVLSSRGSWTSTGDFGWANAVTAGRAVVVLLIGARLLHAPDTLLAAIVLALFALDGFDGWLARRRGTASEFGALFDMETDAYFVLVLELVLYQRGALGPWILVTGVLRYVYVLVRAFVPARRPDVPRSRFGRLAFTGLALGLFFAFALPGPLGTLAALFGTSLVAVSFAISFYDSYAP
jgi:phosphatidylglycerophosphate synthase